VKVENAQPLPPVSEQMKAWSAALTGELRDWPQITLKPFFGFTALYHSKFIVRATTSPTQHIQRELGRVQIR
jgi:hypothetical protein